MNRPVAEVVIPTHDHHLLLPLSVGSAQRQTLENIRIHVVGDGAGEETREQMRHLMEDDPRIIFHDHPKSARTGEEYRHRIVVDSTADFITYLGDDDIMAPDHVEWMHTTLRFADVAFPPHTVLNIDGSTDFQTYSLEDSHWREVALEGTSLFGLTGLAHTTAFYRSLNRGWESTPPGFYTDHFMIEKFIRHEGTRFALASVPTVLHLPSSQRRHMSADERLRELESYGERFTSMKEWNDYRASFLGNLLRHANQQHLQLISLARDHDAVHASFVGELQRSAELQEQLDSIESARVIRLRNFILRSRAIKLLARVRR